MYFKQDVSAAAARALETALSADFPAAKVSNTGSHLLRVTWSLECASGESSKPNHDRFDRMLAKTRHWHVLWPSFMIKVSLIAVDERSKEVTYSLQETIEFGRLAA